jgi:hypothetical protein
MRLRPALYGNALGPRASELPGPGLGVPTAPVFLTSSISGNPRSGNVVEALWTASGFNPISPSYQWLRNGTPIAGATSKTLLLNAGTQGWVSGDDIGCLIELANIIGTTQQTPVLEYSPPSLIDATNPAQTTKVFNATKSAIYGPDEFEMIRDSQIGGLDFLLPNGSYRMTYDMSAPTLAGASGAAGVSFRPDTVQTVVLVTFGVGLTIDFTITSGVLRMLGSGGGAGGYFRNVYVEAI